MLSLLCRAIQESEDRLFLIAFKPESEPNNPLWCLVQVNCTRSHLKSHPIPGLLAWRLALPCDRVHKPGRHQHGPKVSHNNKKSHRRQKDPREHTQTP